MSVYRGAVMPEIEKTKKKKKKKGAKSSPKKAAWPPTREFEELELADILSKSNLPDDFDPTMKEQYLSADDFEETFGMSRDAFNGLAKWKRNAEKKKHGLF